MEFGVGNFNMEPKGSVDEYNKDIKEAGMLVKRNVKLIRIAGNQVTNERVN